MSSFLFLLALFRNYLVVLPNALRPEVLRFTALPDIPSHFRSRFSFSVIISQRAPVLPVDLLSTAVGTSFQNVLLVLLLLNHETLSISLALSLYIHVPKR